MSEYTDIGNQLSVLILTGYDVKTIIDMVTKAPALFRYTRNEIITTLTELGVDLKLNTLPEDEEIKTKTF